MELIMDQGIASIWYFIDWGSNAVDATLPNVICYTAFGDY